MPEPLDPLTEAWHHLDGVVADLVYAATKRGKRGSRDLVRQREAEAAQAELDAARVLGEVLPSLPRDLEPASQEFLLGWMARKLDLDEAAAYGRSGRAWLTDTTTGALVRRLEDDLAAQNRVARLVGALDPGRSPDFPTDRTLPLSASARGVPHWALLALLLLGAVGVVLLSALG